MSNAITLKIKDITSLYGALSSLDGEQKVVEGAEGALSKIVIVPYKFGGKARWAIVKNLGILKRYVDDFGKSRDALINELSSGAGLIQEDDHQTIAKLNQGLTEILETEQEVSGLLKLSEDSLNLDQNQIPVTTLLVLTPLLE